MRPVHTVLLLSALVACNEEGRPDAAVDAGPAFLPILDAGRGQPEGGSSERALPRAFKGYELYAWEESGALRFMLISGTNRLKTLEELRVENSAVERDDGWVAISGSGLSRLEAVLARVPSDSSVHLQSFGGLPELGAEQRSRIEALLARFQP